MTPPAQRMTELSPRTLGRVAGALYLIVIVCGLVGEALIRGRLIAGGDAAATAANLREMESLWRFGIANELLALTCAPGLAVILYALLQPVSPFVALLATLFHVVTESVRPPEPAGSR